MTRRKVIFWNDLNDSYIVSEEYNGDKAEMERFGLGAPATILGLSLWRL